MRFDADQQNIDMSPYILYRGGYTIYMSRNTNEILQDVQKLTRSPGYMHVLAEIICRDLFFHEKDIATIDYRQRLLLQEISFLIGLCLKNDIIINEQIDSERVEDLIRKTRGLLDKLHWSYVHQTSSEMRKTLPASDESSLDKTKKNLTTKKIFKNKAAMIEATFYSAPCVYGIQYLEMAPKLYSFDQDWLSSKGLNLDHAGSICRAIKHIVEAQHCWYVEPDSNPKGRPNNVFNQFIFHRRNILEMTHELNKDKTLTEDDIENFLRFFIACPGEQNKSLQAPGDLNMINFKPVLRVSNELYFIPLSFNLTEAVYKNPGYLMMEDKEYKDKVSSNRGKANEVITFDYFKKIFGEFAFKSIKIKKGKQILTDIDVMGVIGSAAVIVQNKSKRMTIKSRQGDEEYLKKDFKGAVQDAYNQGLESRKAILQNEGYKFIDDNNDEIVLPQGIERVYILCITADIYPAVLFQIDQYLNKQDDDPWPLALSLFDLDILAEYLPDPYDFVFYIRQRVHLHGYIKSDNEMKLIAYHVKYGLLKYENLNHLLITDDSGLDADYMYRKGELTEIDEEHTLKSKWINSTYEQLLAELKTKRNEPKLTDVIFFLKGISKDSIDDFMQFMNEARQYAINGGQPQDGSMSFTYRNKPWGGITYVLESDELELLKKLNYLAEINKYRSKSDKWLAIGAIIGQPSLVNKLSFIWEKWEQSEEMDKTLKQHNKNSGGHFIKAGVSKQYKISGKPKSVKKKNSKAAKKRARKLKKQSQKKSRKK